MVKVNEEIMWGYRLRLTVRFFSKLPYLRLEHRIQCKNEKPSKRSHTFYRNIVNGPIPKKIQETVQIIYQLWVFLRKKVESQNFVGLKVQTCRLQITRNRFPTMHKICHFMLTPIVRFFFIVPITQAILLSFKIRKI